MKVLVDYRCIDRQSYSFVYETERYFDFEAKIKIVIDLKERSISKDEIIETEEDIDRVLAAYVGYWGLQFPEEVAEEVVEVVEGV